MLKSISWQEFFFFITTLIIIYYACSLLLFYHQEILQLLRGKQRSSTDHKSTSQSPQPNPLIGPVRFSDETARPVRDELRTEELQLATQEPEEAMTVADPEAEKLQQDLTEILDQIESLAQVTIQTPTIELQTLYKTLLSNYPGFVGTTHQANISQAITETLSQHGHTITTDEVLSWWPT